MYGANCKLHIQNRYIAMSEVTDLNLELYNGNDGYQQKLTEKSDNIYELYGT